MKIRICFVSNSSSSSFMIIGKILSFDQVVALRLENERPRIYAVSKEPVYDGADGFDLEDDMIDFMLILSDIDNKKSLLNLRHRSDAVKFVCELHIKGVKIKTSMPDWFTFYEAYEVISEESDYYNESIAIPEGMKRYDVEIEYMHTSNGVWDLLERYCTFNNKPYEEYRNENT